MSSPGNIVHPVQTQPGGHPGGQPGNPYSGVPQAGGHTNNTTVIIQEPGVRDWSSGLYDCCDDMGICLCGTFCGLCLSMKISSYLGQTISLQWCLPLRTRLRNHERIHGSVCNDWLTTIFCGTCSLCQMGREVKMIKQQGR